jgi:hypothetical protein
MGAFTLTSRKENKIQIKNQEQGGRTSGGPHHKSYEYEDGGQEQKTEKKGGQGPGWTVAPQGMEM